jgi:hypothetical protein
VRSSTSLISTRWPLSGPRSAGQESVRPRSTMLTGISGSKTVGSCSITCAISNTLLSAGHFVDLGAKGPVGGRAGASSVLIPAQWPSLVWTVTMALSGWVDNNLIMARICTWAVVPASAPTAWRWPERLHPCVGPAAQGRGRQCGWGRIQFCGDSLRGLHRRGCACARRRPSHDVIVTYNLDPANCTGGSCTTAFTYTSTSGMIVPLG